MTNSKNQINKEHPRIKNRDLREQKLRDEIIKTLKERKIWINEYYDINWESKYSKRPITQQDWIDEADRSENHLKDRLYISKLLNNNSWLSFEENVLSLIEKWHTYELKQTLPYLTWLTNKIAFALIEKGKLMDVVKNISHFTWLTAEDCENIASKMLKENVFTLTYHFHEFPIITQKMIDEVIEDEDMAFCIAENMDIYKKQWIDPKSIALKLVEIKKAHFVAANFEKFWWRNLGIDIIYKVLSMSDNGLIAQYLPNIISEKTLDQLPASLFADDRFVALVLSVCPELYDKISNPNKAFIKTIAQKLKWENIGSIDIDSKDWVVSYIRGTVRDTWAGMEYGNYVRAIYNWEEKQTHEIYRDGYSASKDNWNLCYSNTKIESVKVNWDKVTIIIKAINKNYSRDYTFTFDKAKEDITNKLNETEQENFLRTVEDVKKKIIEEQSFRSDKNSWVSMNPYFTSEKVNAEKWIAVVVLHKQIDYSSTTSWNQYAYEAFKIDKDGSYSRVDYKAARDYDRKGGNNIVIDAQDYNI